MKKLIFYSSVLLLIGLFGCEKDIVLQSTTESRSITRLLTSDPDCSLAVEALDSARLKVMLNSYGSYTLFVPSNEAIRTYLSGRGKSKVSDIPGTEWRTIFLYHLYGNIFNSNSFVPGSLPAKTASGEYLGMDISGGLSHTVLNRTVNVTLLDQIATNGVYHKIDAVLTPVEDNLLDFLKKDGRFTIMAQAIEKTGLATLLNTSEANPDSRLRYTAFLETDSLLQANGFNSFEDLAKKYSKNGKYTDDEDSLNMFVKYHILPKNMFLSDFTNGYIETLHEQDFIVLSISKGFSVNPHNVYTFNSVTGKVDTTFAKTGLLMKHSNLMAKNGIVHAVDKMLNIHWPEAVAVTCPFVKDCNKFPTCAGSFALAAETDFATLGGYIKWYPVTQPMQVLTSTSGQNVASKLLRFDPKDVTYYVEMTTDPILKGTYKVCYSWRRISGSIGVPTIDFYFDGVKVAYIDQQQSRAYTPTGTAITTNIEGKTFTLQGDKQRVPLTTVTFTTVKSHTIRLQCAVAGIAMIDAVEFIPVK